MISYAAATAALALRCHDYAMPPPPPFHAATTRMLLMTLPIVSYAEFCYHAAPRRCHDDFTMRLRRRDGYTTLRYDADYAAFD